MPGEFGPMTVNSYMLCCLALLVTVCGANRKKERKEGNLNRRYRGEEKAPAPFIAFLRFQRLLFISARGLRDLYPNWAAPAILRQYRVNSGGRARTTSNCCCHCLGLAGWRQNSGRLFHVATNTFDLQKWDFLFPPPQVESWNSEHCDRVLGTSPDISNQTFFSIYQFDHKKTLLKNIKKKQLKNTGLSNVSLKKVSSERASFGQS